MEELIAKFDYHHMSKSPAVFDYNKLKWMNGEYIKKMDPEKYYERAIPEVRKVISKPLDLKKIADLMKTRIEVFPDIDGPIAFFEELPDYDPAIYTHKKMKTDSAISLAVLKAYLLLLEAQEDWSLEGLRQMIGAEIERSGEKAGKILWPLRIAVSGLAMTPGGAYEIMEILGKEESLLRIRKGIEKLEK